MNGTTSTEAPKYETTKQAAARVRGALKALGITSKMVSVRADGSITCIVRDVRVSKALVERIAGSVERIDRDHTSGEILAGANRFVFVSREQSSLESLVADVAAALDGTDECVIDSVQVSRAVGFYPEWRVYAPGKSVAVATPFDRSYAIQCGAEALAEQRATFRLGAAEVSS